MRKRNFSSALDSLFWWFFALFPVILYAFSFLSHTYTPVTFSEFLSFIGVKVDTTLVFGTLLDLFSSSGVFPLFDSPEIISCLAWFINVEIIHLAVDFILFIPRLCHVWLHNFTSR